MGGALARLQRGGRAMSARQVRELAARQSGIYAIEHRTSRRTYVGSSINIPQRWLDHLALLRKGRSQCRILQNCWTKYGEDAFAFKVLLYCDRADLLFYEQRALDKLPCLLNSSRRADRIDSPEALANLRAAMRRKSTRAKLAAVMLGTKLSASTKAAMSRTRRGRPWTAVQIAACEVWRQDPKSLKRRAASHRGLRHTKATKSKIAAAHRGMVKPWVSERNRLLRRPA